MELSLPSGLTGTQARLALRGLDDCGLGSKERRDDRLQRRE